LPGKTTSNEKYGKWLSKIIYKIQIGTEKAEKIPKFAWKYDFKLIRNKNKKNSQENDRKTAFKCKK
jgi:hypothetical protein